MKTKKGFTLIELMIVIAIITILASILIPSFIKARLQSQLACCESNLKVLATALEMYNTDNALYPPNAVPLVPDYIRAIPNCPLQNMRYAYTLNDYTGHPTNYTLYCRQAGGHLCANCNLEGYPQYNPNGGLFIK